MERLFSEYVATDQNLLQDVTATVNKTYWVLCFPPCYAKTGSVASNVSNEGANPHLYRAYCSELETVHNLMDIPTQLGGKKTEKSHFSGHANVTNQDTLFQISMHHPTFSHSPPESLTQHPSLISEASLCVLTSFPNQPRSGRKEKYHRSRGNAFIVRLGRRNFSTRSKTAPGVHAICFLSPLSATQQQMHDYRGIAGHKWSILSSRHSTSDSLTHTNSKGQASMVDVSSKNLTQRLATASATVILGAKAFNLIRDNQLSKGDAVSVARLAGIMAAKQTSLLIPLCHSIQLHHVAISVELKEERHMAVIKSICRTSSCTGVEMEALTAVTVAALTLYDMCKAISHSITITDIQLCKKTGGQTGDYQRSDDC